MIYICLLSPLNILPPGPSGDIESIEAQLEPVEPEPQLSQVWPQRRHLWKPGWLKKSIIAS